MSILKKPTIERSDLLKESDKKNKVSTKKYRKIRDTLSEKQIDKMINDSFPASDPPSTY